MSEQNKQLENRELNDNDLGKVNGGSNLSLHFFNTKEEVRFIFYVGDEVYVKETIFSSKVRCRIVGREIFDDPQYHCFLDAYIVRAIDGHDLYTRVLRDDIVNMAA